MTRVVLLLLMLPLMLLLMVLITMGVLGGLGNNQGRGQTTHLKLAGHRQGGCGVVDGHLHDAPSSGPCDVDDLVGVDGNEGGQLVGGEEGGELRAAAVAGQGRGSAVSSVGWLVG